MATFSHFDIVRGVAIDPMLGIYGGVTKALISLWFDTCHHSQPWYCKSKLLKVNERLQKISPTYETTKCSTSLDQRKYWKASEYQYFLLFYSLPCMRDVLPGDRYATINMHYLLHLTDMIMESVSAIQFLHSELSKTSSDDMRTSYNL
uniref:Uncharacterized protein n=1 Tax=Amphimedon queenslandica TaxID=400682 RepID=A0A1X7SKB6_AMPQE